MRIGYERVSTGPQNLEGQRQALEGAGCEQIYSDKAQRTNTARPGYHEALRALRPGDEFVMVRLDRAVGSIEDAVKLLNMLRKREVRFISLLEGIDTGTPLGEAIFLFAAVLAQLEINVIRERTALGQAAARANGRRGGRRSTVTPAKLARARRMIAEDYPVSQIASELDLSRGAVYRAIGPEIRAARARAARAGDSP